jgi:Zn-dependent metalloprotease
MCEIIPKKILKKIAENDPNENRRAYFQNIVESKKEDEFREKRKRIQSDLKKGILPKNLDRVHTHRLTVYDNQRLWDYSKSKVFEDFSDLHDATNLYPKRLFTRDLDRVSDLFHDSLNRESFDNNNARVESFLKYGTDYVNAYWDGEYLVFGEGDGIYFKDFSKDYTVVSHELGHAITQYESNLEYEMQSGALNEHVSDVFGICAYQKKYGLSVERSNWIIGPNVFTKKVNAKGLRSFKNEVAYDDPVVGNDDQPKFMADYKDLPNTSDGDWGGVHINSGICNHTFYLFNQKLGGKTWLNGSLKIWYNTLLKENGLGTKTTFKEFANKSLDMAFKHGPAGSMEKLESSWKETGVLT